MFTENNKNRRKTIRLQNWDYSWEAAYFITICTKNMLHYFGQIENEKMNLSKIGVIAEILWYEIKTRRKNIELAEYVIMPNHIHGIIIIKNENNSVEKRRAFSQSDEKTIGQNRFQNQGKNTISSIIGGYKSAVTKHCNRLNFEFEWQPRFYDHIIRNEKSYNQISNYIIENPGNWEEDKFFS